MLRSSMINMEGAKLGSSGNQTSTSPDPSELVSLKLKELTSCNVMYVSWQVSKEVCMKEVEKKGKKKKPKVSLNYDKLSLHVGIFVSLLHHTYVSCIYEI